VAAGAVVVTWVVKAESTEEMTYRESTLQESRDGWQFVLGGDPME
jgi:hypothetical protein